MPIELNVRPLRSEPLRWQTTLERFEIGRDPGCELPFAGAEHDMVSWRHARIEGQNGRYTLTDLGSTNKTYVNGALAEGPMALAAGDQIRLGQEGPRLDVVSLQAVVPGQRAPGAAAPAAAATVAPPPVHHPEFSAGSPTWPWLAAVGGIVAVGCLVGAVLVLATGSGSQGPSAQAPNVSTASEATTADAPAANGAAPQPTAASTPPAPVDAQSAAPPIATSSAATSSTAPDDALAAARAALHAVVAEHPDGKLMALVTSACAVERETLAATASAALELASLQQAGWKLWAMDPSTRARLPVTEIKVYGGFGNPSTPPADRIYYDAAQLKVDGVLPHTVKYATLSEAKIEQGFPLTCVGLNHTPGESITRFDELAPLTARGKVLAVTKHSSDAGAMSLMHVQGDWSVKLHGGGVFDGQGRLVGLFVTTTPDDVKPQVHYCTSMWSAAAAGEASQWLTPEVPPAASPPAGAAPNENPSPPAEF